MRQGFRLNQTFHSTVDRLPMERRVLHEWGGEITILRLQGYLFFGTANVLLDRVRARLNDQNLPPLRFLILDFSRVSGLDSSAVASFARICQLTEAGEVALVLTQLSADMKAQLEKGRFDDGGAPC